MAALRKASALRWQPGVSVCLSVCLHGQGPRRHGLSRGEEDEYSQGGRAPRSGTTAYGNERPRLVKTYWELPLFMSRAFGFHFLCRETRGLIFPAPSVCYSMAILRGLVRAGTERSMPTRADSDLSFPVIKTAFLESRSSRVPLIILSSLSPVGPSIFLY